MSKERRNAQSIAMCTSLQTLFLAVISCEVAHPAEIEILVEGVVRQSLEQARNYLSFEQHSSATGRGCRLARNLTHSRTLDFERIRL